MTRGDAREGVAVAETATRDRLVRDLRGYVKPVVRDERPREHFAVPSRRREYSRGRAGSTFLRLYFFFFEFVGDGDVREDVERRDGRRVDVATAGTVRRSRTRAAAAKRFAKRFATRGHRAYPGEDPRVVAAERVRLENTRRRRQEQRAADRAAAVPRGAMARNETGASSGFAPPFPVSSRRHLQTRVPPRASTETTAPVSSHARARASRASPCAWPWERRRARQGDAGRNARVARGEVHLARARAPPATRSPRGAGEGHRGVFQGPNRPNRRRAYRRPDSCAVAPTSRRSTPETPSARAERASFRRARRARPPRPARVARGARAARARTRALRLSRRSLPASTPTQRRPTRARRGSLRRRAREQPRRRTRRLPDSDTRAFANVPPPASPAKTRSLSPSARAAEPRSRARALRGSGRHASQCAATSAGPYPDGPGSVCTTTVCARRTGASVATRSLAAGPHAVHTRAAPSSEVVTSATVFVKEIEAVPRERKASGVSGVSSFQRAASPPWGAAGSARGTRARPRRARNASPAPPTRRAPRRTRRRPASCAVYQTSPRRRAKPYERRGTIDRRRAIARLCFFVGRVCFFRRATRGARRPPPPRRTPFRRSSRRQPPPSPRTSRGRRSPTRVVASAERNEKARSSRRRRRRLVPRARCGDVFRVPAPRGARRASRRVPTRRNSGVRAGTTPRPRLRRARRARTSRGNPRASPPPPPRRPRDTRRARR